MRALKIALVCIGLAVALVPSVFAGGWAVTTLDALPSEIRAGQSYSIGYVIRQHGQTPYTNAQTAIEIRSSDREPPTRFRARPEGAAGHYVAEVIFPSAGEWRWDVDQTPFEPQRLGTLTVLPAALATQPSEPALAGGDSSVVQGGWPTALRIGVPVALAVVIALAAVGAATAHTRFGLWSRGNQGHSP
jgi:hypothetical protein